MKISDAVKFVLENRKNKVCKGWTPYQITYDIDVAIKMETFAYTTNEEGQLTGICWGMPNHITKVLCIKTLLTTDKAALKTLVQYFKNNFKGWMLTAERHNRFVAYNTEKLIQKLYV